MMNIAKAFRGRGIWIALAGFAAGALSQGLPFSPPGGVRAEDGAHATASGAAASIKAPITEVLRCPLAFKGLHLLKEMPEVSRIAYHYCKPLNDDLSQCLLYDGTGPDARLIGVEYLVSAAIFDKMPAEEKTYWHDHKYEIDGGLLKSLTQTGEEEKATLARIRTLYGKVFHTWTNGKDYPQGPARLFWAVTGAEPFLDPTLPHAPTAPKSGR